MLPTVENVRKDFSGTRGCATLRKIGYQRCPIVKFGEREYLIFHYNFPRPGLNTAEVIDVTAFDKGAHFTIFRTTLDPECQAYGYVLFADEGWSVLTIYDREPNKLDEFTNPISAVLSYRIEPPNCNDIEIVTDRLDTQLQENGPAEWLSRM